MRRVCEAHDLAALLLLLLLVLLLLLLLLLELLREGELLLLLGLRLRLPRLGLLLGLRPRPLPCRAGGDLRAQSTSGHVMVAAVGYEEHGPSRWLVLGKQQHCRAA